MKNDNTRYDGIDASVYEAKEFKDMPMFIKVTQSDSNIFLLIYLSFWGPVRLTLYSTYSVSFFSRNSVFLSQQFSQNSVFQPVLAKFQTSERGLCYGFVNK